MPSQGTCRLEQESCPGHMAGGTGSKVWEEAEPQQAVGSRKGHMSLPSSLAKWRRNDCVGEHTVFQ